MTRFGFVGKRLAQTVPMLAGIVLVVFLLLQLTPGDPARNVAGLRATQAQLVEVRHDLGLDRPIFIRYGNYVADVAHGNLGYSYKSHESVVSMISGRVQVTGWLLTAAILMTVLIAVPLAVIGATRRDRPVDHGIRIAGLVTMSMPSFWVAVMLVLVVAIPTGLPVGGFGETGVDHLRSVILPGFTLAIGMAPVLIRSLRAGILTVLDTDYVATARSIGVPEHRIVRRFVLRNAATSSVTLFALEIGYVLFGAVVVETAFALPGVGQGLVLSARGRDLPAIQGYTLLFAVVVVVAFLIADVVTALLDPRVEISA